MNIAEKYALECGVKISQPSIEVSFIPTTHDKYILFDTRSKYPNKIGIYDFYNEVVELISPYLKENDIAIYYLTTDNGVQIPADKCFITIAKKQEAYLISKSKMLIANENYSLYIASAFNVLNIGLYSLFNPENTRPVWNKNSQIILKSHRENNLPSYGLLSENPKTINFISPYEIAQKILDGLNIEHDLYKYTLINIGKAYNHKIVEVVPDFITDNSFLSNKSINLRLDYVKNLSIELLNFWLSNRKVNIITDKDINLKVLAPYKKNIQSITIMISEDITETFLSNCKAAGFKIKIFCDKQDKLKDYRFKFLDWEIQDDTAEKDILNSLKNLNSESKFVSSKKLFSKGKAYSCKANYLCQKSLDNNEETVILNEEFEKELQFFKIYNERKESAPSTSNS